MSIANLEKVLNANRALANEMFSISCISIIPSTQSDASIESRHPLSSNHRFAYMDIPGLTLNHPI